MKGLYDFFDRIKQLDAYPKTLEDFRVKTLAGALGKFHQSKHIKTRGY
jgi:hypothetical protein